MLVYYQYNRYDVNLSKEVSIWTPWGNLRTAIQQPFMLKILFASNICLLARGPPAQNALSFLLYWIKSDSLFREQDAKVNQFWFTHRKEPFSRKRINAWFTTTFRPDAPRVGRMPRIAHGRDELHKPAVWRVCGAVGRREPYNLLLENKTYYTQNYDTMR